MPNPDALPRSPTPADAPGWKLRLEDRLGLLDPIQVVPFRSFGTPRRLHVRGRVVEQKGVGGDLDGEEPWWKNMLDTARRLDSDEVPGATLRARFGGRTWETRSDHEGYFVLDLDLEAPVGPGWHTVELALLDSVGAPAEGVVRERVLVPGPAARLAVVSDVDDTIIRSRSTDALAEAAILFGQGAAERTVFAGVPPFYRALAAGPDGHARNPVFYVSRSGWNLYDLFVRFMDLHDLPAGPLFLSDLRVIEDPSEVMRGQGHKFGSIDALMRTYPELDFVLVGDSGMHDPELYADLVRSHPGRVRAVYIHDVTGGGRDGEVARVAERLAEQGVPLVHAEDAARPAEHAAALGLIGADGLAAVRRAVAEAHGAGG